MTDFTIRVTPEVLMSASEEITSKTNTIKSSFSEIRTKMKQTSAYWVGDAADLHRTLFEEQIPAMEEIISRFNEQADKLKQIAGNYVGTMQAVETVVEELPSDVIV